ncbi:MAG: FAD-binding oxidoreductase [Anaerolineae bacterium]|nr:FAD-binding oxidoreductase [Anaerolineae bacterium]
MAKFVSRSGQLPTTADVVIIGGGPAGASAAWALECASPGIRTVIIEQGSQLASGASNASLENFRTCWTSLGNARLMGRSIDVFRHAQDLLGADIGVKERGYLFLGFNEEQADGLRADVQRLHQIGLTHVEYLDAAELQARFPQAGPRAVAGKYDPIAGWLDSHALVHAFVRQAANCQVLLDVPETRIEVEGGRVVGVWTPSGRISAATAIIAAGARSRQVGRTAGVELPVVVRPRQSFTTPWRHADFPEHSPMLIGAAPFAHVRPEAQTGAIFGHEYNWNDKLVKADGEPAHDYLIDPIYPVEQLKDPRFPSVTLAILARQFGHADGEGFANPRYLRGIDHRINYYVFRDNAYYADEQGVRRKYVSQRAIIDAWSEVGGLYLSIAHAGHGIMSSPAAGEIMAARVLGQPLSDPAFADFNVDAPYADYDRGGLSKD